MPPPQISGINGNDLIISHDLHFNYILWWYAPPPIYRSEKALPPIQRPYIMIMIIYIIFIGLHHYKYEPKLCILGSYVTQTILPELWLRLVRLDWHIIYNFATQPEVGIQPITQDGFMG